MTLCAPTGEDGQYHLAGIVSRVEMITVDSLAPILCWAGQVLGGAGQSCPPLALHVLGGGKNHRRRMLVRKKSRLASLRSQRSSSAAGARGQGDTGFSGQLLDISLYDKIERQAVCDGIALALQAALSRQAYWVSGVRGGIVPTGVD
jgi:hypothetical protein